MNWYDWLSLAIAVCWIWWFNVTLGEIAGATKRSADQAEQTRAMVGDMLRIVREMSYNMTPRRPNKHWPVSSSFMTYALPRGVTVVKEQKPEIIATIIGQDKKDA